MPLISKNYDSDTLVGTWEKLPPIALHPPGSTSKKQKSDRMQEDKAPGDSRFFSASHYSSNSRADVNVYRPGGSPTITVKSLPYIDFSTSAHRDHARHGTISGPSDGAYAADLLARTNPSRPDIDLPVFLTELREIPQLINIAGKNIFQTVAKANLAYHFGWKPLISDLIKIVNFHDIVERRLAELNKFYESGLRCTVELDRVATSGSRSIALTPLNIYNSVSIVSNSSRSHFVTQQVVRGHVKWKPTGLPPGGFNNMRNLAMRAALGLYANPAAAWELIPFSWLADWFTSIGSYLNASRNLIPASPYDISIMKETKTEVVVPMTLSTSTYIGQTVVPDLIMEHTSKVRTPATPSLSAHLPWLTARQWSILLSLAVLKGSSPRFIAT